MRAAGVDPGVWHLMTGLPYLVRASGSGCAGRKVPVRGLDLAGVVEAVGARVTRFAAGGRGATAPARAAPSPSTRSPGEDRLGDKPANLSFEQAAVTPVSGMTALRRLRDARACGPGSESWSSAPAAACGTFAVQIARAVGARHRRWWHREGRPRRFPRRRRRHRLHPSSQIDAPGHGDDVIIDTAGNRPVSLLRRALTPRGTLVLVGGEGGGRLLGGFDRLLRRPAPVGRSSPVETMTAHEAGRELAGPDRDARGRNGRAGRRRTYPLADGADAVRDLHDGRALGKLVLTI